MALIFFSSCRKDIISSDPSFKLGFSTDSVIFDTVFTSIGSVTKQLMVYNKNKDKISISSVSLVSGSQSPYRINVDGTPGLTVENIEIAPNDSAYIFVRVTIDPQNINNPFVVEDELRFVTNGNEQLVKLVAWGQDAVYILADQQIVGFPPFKIIADSLQTTIWTADKPYVVFGYALINSYGTLIIEEGARVHFHDKSGLWAYVDGVLKVRGSLENPVVFQGDRLDQDYRNIPGQWDRIWLMEGRAGFDHEIEHAIIRNGYIGIQAESFLRATENRLSIKNTVIENHTGIGFMGRFFAVDANNIVVANCGQYTIRIESGGSYRFRHCSIANEWRYGVSNTSSVFFHNVGLDIDSNFIALPLNIKFANTIIYGSSENEIERYLLSGADTTYVFDHCLIRQKKDWNNDIAFINCIFNKDPLFRDYANFDFQLDTLSPSIDIGSTVIAAEVPMDILGVSRTTLPDLGAYEFVKPDR
ncbi:MAG: hypothetical protein Q8S18_00550 [Bacteroidales bacterium]|nr:hypothetical protein [Bacteroidales bacterium]